ncbi:MAG: DUF177 domain-containing protein [Bacteroidia bacterium]|nr:MAG: DUF177 domain-containing protein [Bacteroidia bacterium]
MDPLKPYKIGFTGLSEGNHRFLFDIGADFFSCFHESEVGESAVGLDLNLEKRSNMLVLDFVFKGWLALTCGRCLSDYHEPVDYAERLYVKFGEDYIEESEDVVVIPFTESHFDIAHYIYEFIHLHLPLRRVHPEISETGCDKEMLNRLTEHQPENMKTKGTEPPEDSPFNILKGIRFDKEN